MLLPYKSEFSAHFITFQHPKGYLTMQRIEPNLRWLFIFKLLLNLTIQVIKLKHENPESKCQALCEEGAGLGNLLQSMEKYQFRFPS